MKTISSDQPEHAGENVPKGTAPATEKKAGAIVDFLRNLLSIFSTGSKKLVETSREAYNSDPDAKLPQKAKNVGKGVHSQIKQARDARRSAKVENAPEAETATEDKAAEEKTAEAKAPETQTEAPAAETAKETPAKSGIEGVSPKVRARTKATMDHATATGAISPESIHEPDAEEEKAREKLTDKLPKDFDTSKLKEKGLMAGGGIIAADGVRRMAKKDSNGKRQIKRGVAQVALGAGTFAAAVMAKRNAATETEVGEDQGQAR